MTAAAFSRILQLRVTAPNRPLTRPRNTSETRTLAIEADHNCPRLDNDDPSAERTRPRKNKPAPSTVRPARTSSPATSKLQTPRWFLQLSRRNTSAIFLWLEQNARSSSLQTHTPTGWAALPPPSARFFSSTQQSA